MTQVHCVVLDNHNQHQGLNMNREKQVEIVSDIMDLLDDAIKHSRKSRVREDITKSQRLLLNMLYSPNDEGEQK